MTIFKSQNIFTSQLQSQRCQTPRGGSLGCCSQRQSYQPAMMMVMIMMMIMVRQAKLSACDEDDFGDGDGADAADGDD